MTGVVFAHRINEWGQILLQAPPNAPIVSAVMGPLGEMISELASDILDPRLVSINDFGEILGVYRSPFDGQPKAFLRLPGLADFDTSLAASYPNLFEDGTTADLFSADMNDYGEFAFNFEVGGLNSLANIEFYFFDGEYRTFKGANDLDVQLIALNNQPQILFSARIPNGSPSSYDTEYRLFSGDQSVALSKAHEETSNQVSPIYSLLNDDGAMVGYRRVGSAYQHEPFILQRDQDADEDGLSDDWEAFYGFDPNSPSDASEDGDGDGYTNLAEFKLNRNPNVAEVPSLDTGNLPDLRPGIDTDGDGMPNVWEILYGLNWEDPSDALLDLDRDGYSNLEEFLLGTTPVGAPIFEPMVVESDSGDSLANLFFGPEGAILGRGISNENRWMGIEWETDGSSQWYHPADSGGSSQILAANSEFAGGYETAAGSSKKIGALWSRSSGSSEPVVNFSGVQFKDSKVVKLASNGASGVVSFTREESPFKTELALLIGQQIQTILTIQDTGGVDATSIVESSIVLHGSGSGAAYARFPGYKQKVIHWDALQSPQVTVFDTGRYSPNPVANLSGSPVFAWPTAISNQSAVSILEDGVVISVSEPGVMKYDLKSVSDEGLILGVASVRIEDSVKIKPFSLRKGAEDQWVFKFFETESGQSFSGVQANGESELVGRTYNNSRYQYAFWRGTETKFDLLELVAGSGDFELSSVDEVGATGSILGRIYDDHQSRHCVLVPVSDTDGDGATDQWEIAHALDPFDPADGAFDPDGDGLVNSDEFRNRTDPRVADSDQDTMKDGWEVEWGFDPLVASDAYADPDRDKVQNRFEHALKTSPTGIYRLETSNVPELDPGYSPSLQARGSSSGSPFTVVRGKVSGVVGTYIVDDGGVFEEIPPLAPGKAVYIKEIGNSGALYGYAYDGNNRPRFVVFLRGESVLKVVDIPTSSTSPYIFPIDISQDERSVLVRRRTPEEDYSTDVLSVDLSSTLASVNVELSVSFPAAGQSPSVDGLSPYFDPSICDGPTHVIGVLSFVDPDGLHEERIIGVEKDQNGFDDLVDLETLLAIDTEDSSEIEGWGYIGRPSDPGEHFTYTWDGWSAESGRYYHKLISSDYDGKEAKVFKTRGDNYPQVRDANTSAQALIESGGRHYLSSPSHCLKIDRLRVGASNGPGVEVHNLPRVGELISNGPLGAKFLNREGQVSGLARFEEEPLFWILSEANDFDGNGEDDDLERFRDELGAAYLAANTGGSRDDQAFLNLISSKTSQQAARSEVGGSKDSDRDGDGIEDHLDAHPDDRRIDWEKGKRPSFAVVEVEGSENSFPLGENSTVDFSSSGVVLVKDDGGETKVFFPGGDSQVYSNDGEILDDSILNTWEDAFGLNFVNGYAGYFRFPSLWRKSGGTSQQVLYAENAPLDVGYPGESITAFHTRPPNSDFREPGLQSHLTGSILTVRGGEGFQQDDGSPPGFDWIAIQVGISGGDHENLMSGLETVVDRDPDEQLSDRGRAIVSEDGVNWSVLPKPSRARLGITDEVGDDYSIWAKSFPAVGSPINSSGSLGLPQLLAATYLVSGVPEPLQMVHAVYEVGSATHSEGVYRIKDLVPEFAPLDGGHSNHVGVCRVVGKTGSNVDRSLWAAGSKLYTKKGAGSFRETELSFANVGFVRGISTQGWIATTGGLSGSPQILYASPDGSPWRPLQSFVRDEEDSAGNVTKEYSVEEVYELERNGLILAKVAVVEGNRTYHTLAILTPIETASEDSSEAISTPELVVPDRYRSISLDGRPKHEGAPQGEAEEDLPAERGNIDVHTRQLKYDTSHAYLQVPASDLALQVTQVYSPSPISIPPWSDRDKADFLLSDGSIDFEERSRRREAQMARSVGPFGVNWSSNLSASVKLTPVLKKTAPGRPQEFSHYSVTLTDEAGRTHEFQSDGDDLSTFYVKGSRFVDAKAYAMSLKRVLPNQTDPEDSYLLLEKKYGTTLRFDWVGEVPAIQFEVSDSGGFASLPPVYQARLTRVSDRFDSDAPGKAPSALIYEYPPNTQNQAGASGPAFIPTRIYAEGREALGINIVTEALASSPGRYAFPLIRGITDPRGSNTTFSYKWSNIGGAQIPVLHTVRKSDGGESVFEYYPARIASPIVPDQKVDLLLEGTIFESFDDLQYVGASSQGGEMIELEFSDQEILEAKCHLNLKSITNAVGETYTFEYEDDGRYDSVVAEYSALARVIPALKNHPIANKKVVKDVLAILKEGIDESISESYEERLTRGGGVLLSKTEGDEGTKMIFGVPNVGGPDRIKRVILPPDPSLSDAGQAVVALDQWRPRLAPAGEGEGPPSNLDEVTNFPIRWISDRSRELPAGYHVRVTDAAGSETEYRFEGVIYGAASSDLARDFGGVSSQPDTKVLAASALAYTTIAITSVLSDKSEEPARKQTVRYQLDPLAGFALKSSTDVNGHRVEYEYGDTIDGGPGVSKAAYHFISDHLNFIDQPLDESREAGVRYSDPTREIYRSNQNLDEETRSRTYAYSDHYRIMEKATDFRGAETVWTVAENGNRSREVAYSPDSDGKVLLKQTDFEYGSQFPGFLTRSIVVSDPLPELRKQDLVTEFEPHPMGWVESTILNPGGLQIETHSDYDEVGNKSSSTDARGNTTTFTYDSVGRLVTTRFPGPENATKEIFYNKASRIIRSRDENGVDTLYEYDHRGRRVTTGLDLNGNRQLDNGDIITRKIFNNVNRVVAVTDPNGNRTSNEYDRLHRLVSTTNALDHQAKLFYDEAFGSIPGSGLLDGSGYTPSRSLDPRGFISEVALDSLYRVTESRKEYQKPDDRDSTEAEAWEDRPLELHAFSETEYDENGNSTKATIYRSPTGGSLVTDTKFDLLNRPTLVTVAPGTDLESKTRTKYSFNGLPWKVVAFDGLEGLERCTETEFDDAGRPVKVWSPDPLTGEINKAVNGSPLEGSPCVTTVYDDNGNITATIDALKNRSDFQYDARNRQWKVENPTVYDDEGGMNRRPTVTSIYDPVGNVISTIDPRGIISIIDYDRANRPYHTVSAFGLAEQIETSTEYDFNGNATAVTDPNGHITVNHYDSLNRLIATAVNPKTGNPSRNLASLESGDIVVGNQYDASGNLVRVADGMATKTWTGDDWSGAHVTGFTFDGFGRQTSLTWDIGTPAEKVEESFYDALLATHTIDPKGQRKEFVYDALLRMTQVNHPENDPSDGKSATALLENLEYSYQNAGGSTVSGPGPLIAVTYPGASPSQLGGRTRANVSYTLDFLGRQTSETSAGVTHGHVYDRNGNRRMTSCDASDRKLLSFYDSHNRLSSCVETDQPVSDPLEDLGYTGSRSTRYYYNASGAVVRKELPALYVYKQYDGLGRTKNSYSYSSSWELAAGLDYSQPVPGSGDASGYDAAGNLRYVRETYSDLSSRIIRNDYDATNRLSLEQDTRGGVVKDTSYEYDKANNRTAKLVDDAAAPGDETKAVSYTHLTLPTIYSV